MFLKKRKSKKTISKYSQSYFLQKRKVNYIVKWFLVKLEEIFLPLKTRQSYFYVPYFYILILVLLILPPLVNLHFYYISPYNCVCCCRSTSSDLVLDLTSFCGPICSRKSVVIFENPLGSLIWGKWPPDRTFGGSDTCVRK